MKNQLLDDNLFNGNTPQLDAATVKKINLLKIEVNDNIKKVQYARYVFVGLCLLAVVGMIIGIGTNEYGLKPAWIVGEAVIMIILYGTCGALLPRKPMLWIGVGLAIYILFHLLVFIAMPASIVQGFLIKIVVLAGLISGLVAAGKLKKDLRELRMLGVPEREIKRAQDLEKMVRTRVPV